MHILVPYVVVTAGRDRYFSYQFFRLQFNFQCTFFSPVFRTRIFLFQFSLQFSSLFRVGHLFFSCFSTGIFYPNFSTTNVSPRCVFSLIFLLKTFQPNFSVLFFIDAHFFHLFGTWKFFTQFYYFFFFAKAYCFSSFLRLTIFQVGNVF